MRNLTAVGKLLMPAQLETCSVNAAALSCRGMSRGIDFFFILRYSSIRYGDIAQ